MNFHPIKYIQQKLAEKLANRSFYICPSCGFRFLKSSTLLSGFKDDSFLGLHVHCKKCGSIVACFLSD